MHTRLKKNLICSVLCVDIVGQTRKPDADQIRHKARFQAVVERALQGIAPNDRVILDTGDGAAIAFLGVPEEALTVALLIADGMMNDANLHPADRIALRAGMHLGPIRVVRDINDTFNIVSDGLNAAQRIMEFAAPGRTLVSRAYYDMVAPENPDIQRMLTRFGIKTDTHGREHDLYLLGGNEAGTGFAWPSKPRAWVKLAGLAALVLATVAWLVSGGDGLSAFPSDVSAALFTQEAATGSTGSNAAEPPSEHATTDAHSASSRKRQGHGSGDDQGCSEGARMLNQCD